MASRVLLPADEAARCALPCTVSLLPAALRPSRAWLDLLGHGAPPVAAGSSSTSWRAARSSTRPVLATRVVCRILDGVPHAAWRILEAVGVAVGRGRAALEAEAATCAQEASKAAEVRWAAWRLPPWCPDLVQRRDPLLATCSRIAMEERFPGVGAGGELPELAPRRHALYDAQGTRTGFGRAARPRTVWCTTGGGAGGEAPERRGGGGGSQRAAGGAAGGGKGAKGGGGSRARAEARGGGGREAQGSNA